MRLFLTFCLLCSFASAQELAFVRAFGSKVYFEPPDTSRWDLEQNVMDTLHVKYVLKFKHRPILDTEGREVEPVVAIIAESVKDSSDVIVYSAWKRIQTPFEVKKVLAYDSTLFTHRNVIGYEGQYEREGVVHMVLVVHMREHLVGVQVICDSSDEIFPQVEKDMRRFIRSIGIDQ